MNVHTPARDIVAYVSENPVAAFTDEAAYSEFYEKVKAEVSSHVPDVSTEKGRKEIASLAYKVTRSKTAIDAAGKKLNEEARAQIGKVDAQRRKIRDELDALAAEVRQPLTEYEEAEKKRVAEAQGILDRIKEFADVSVDDGSAYIAHYVAKVESIVIDPEIFPGLLELQKAQSAKANAIEMLAQCLARARQHEADQAELARLRAEQEERERAEREAAEKAEAERLEQDRREREAAELKAREEAAAERARQEEQRKAREAIEAAEAEARAVKEKAEREERERQAAIERTRREEEERAADRKHRSNVMSAAKTAIMTCGADEETAKKIVLAIVAGEVPHTVLKF